MSALGQKRTCAAQKGVSALPPIATVKADPNNLMLGSRVNQQQDYPKRTGVPLRLER
jgi:hypothetical protein